MKAAWSAFETEFVVGSARSEKPVIEILGTSRKIRL
jgi:hypothetical protein